MKKLSLFLILACLFSISAQAQLAFKKKNPKCMLSSKKEYLNKSWFRAISTGNLEKIKHFINCRINPNLQNKDGRTALHIASWEGYKDVAQLLLIAGADPNAKNKKDETALHLASWKGHEDVAELLLIAGVDLNAQTVRGETALYIASRKGYKNVAQLLRIAGADPHITNNMGRTPPLSLSEAK